MLLLLLLFVECSAKNVAMKGLSLFMPVLFSGVRVGQVGEWYEHVRY